MCILVKLISIIGYNLEVMYDLLMAKISPKYLSNDDNHLEIKLANMKTSGCFPAIKPGAHAHIHKNTRIGLATALTIECRTTFYA